MHELSIATELYSSLRAEVDGRGGGRIVEAKIVVGELSAIEPRLLHFAWEAVVEDGPDRGAALDIEWRPVVQRCTECGVVEASESNAWLRLCPQCAEPLQLEGGRELDVVSLAFDEASANEEA